MTTDTTKNQYQVLSLKPEPGIAIHYFKISDFINTLFLYESPSNYLEPNDFHSLLWPGRIPCYGHAGYIKPGRTSYDHGSFIPNCGLKADNHAPAMPVIEKSYHNFNTLKNLIFKKNDFKIPFLSSREIKRVNQFKALKKQIEWMAGRFLVKQMIKSVLDHKKKLEEILISYHTEGAPFLADYPFLKISISHSKDYAAAVICTNQDKDIGLDIEKTDKMPDSSFLKIAFTQKELTNMKKTPEEIFQRWTVKEAFLKYIKKGFNESLHKVEVINNQILHHSTKADVSIFSVTIDDSYTLSLVTGPVYSV